MLILMIICDFHQHKWTPNVQCMCWYCFILLRSTFFHFSIIWIFLLARLRQALFLLFQKYMAWAFWRLLMNPSLNFELTTPCCKARTVCVPYCKQILTVFVFIRHVIMVISHPWLLPKMSRNLPEIMSRNLPEIVRHCICRGLMD